MYMYGKKEPQVYWLLINTLRKSVLYTLLLLSVT